jgi:HlyD family secretion protein
MKPTLKLIISLALVTVLAAACGEKGPETMVGTLERDRIEIRVESNEPITSIHVTDGQAVSAGTLILEQDSNRHRARVDQQQALRNQAAARLAELQRGPRVEAIRESQARLGASEVLTRNAQADLVRAQDIFDRGLSNQADLDDARTHWQASSARERADRESLASLLSGTTVEELQQAQAALDAFDAQLRLAQLDLQRLQLSAPAGGMIDKVLYETGERPQAGSTVAVLLDDRRSYARIYVPEHLKAQMTPGARLEIRLDGVSGTRQGIVRWVSADASFTPYFALTEHDRSRLSFLAEVDIENAGPLPVGVPLEAWLAAGAAD